MGERDAGVDEGKRRGRHRRRPCAPRHASSRSSASTGFPASTSRRPRLQVANPSCRSLAPSRQRSHSARTASRSPVGYTVWPSIHQCQATSSRKPWRRASSKEASKLLAGGVVLAHQQQSPADVLRGLGEAPGVAHRPGQLAGALERRQRPAWIRPGFEEPERVENARLVRPVAELPCERERLGRVLPCALVVGHEEREIPAPEECAAAQCGSLAGRRVQRPSQRRGPLHEPPGEQPPVGQRRAEAQRLLGLDVRACGRSPRTGSPRRRRARRPSPGPSPGSVQCFRRGPGTRRRDGRAAGRPRRPPRAGRARTGEPSPAARSGSSDSRSSTSTSDLSTSEVSRSRIASRSSSSSAHTDSQASSVKPPWKTPSRRSSVRSGSSSSVVAPVDRRAQRLQTRQRTARAAGEQVEAVGEPGGDVLDRQDPHARGRELDRERDAVEVLADLGDVRRVLVGDREVRPDLRGALDEQAHGVGVPSDCASAGPRSAGSDSDGTRQVVSPPTPSGSRLVATTVTSGQPCSSASASCLHGSRTCSQLSSSTSARWAARWETAASTGVWPGSGRTPTLVARADSMSAGSESGASSSHQRRRHSGPARRRQTEARAASCHSRRRRRVSAAASTRAACRARRARGRGRRSSSTGWGDCWAADPASAVAAHVFPLTATWSSSVFPGHCEC